MNLEFLTSSPDERGELIAECGKRLGIAPVIIEKDFWVCWMLDVLFQHSSFADSLVFKGGTSLSKVFGAINRFSEDIDLSVSTEFLELPEPGDSRNQANKWMTNAEAACTEAARDQFLPELEQLIGGLLEPLKERSDHRWLEFVVDAASDSPVVLFHYPTTQPSGFDYLKRSVKLELGSLTEQRPIGKHPIRPWLADEFPQIFPDWSCEVVALEIERSFWEKATILHAEHHRPENKPTPDRYSRHYADTAALAKHADGQRAMTLSDVRQKVVDWKARFFGSAWARYDLAVPGSFRLVPADARVDALRRDYQAMHDMYLSEPPSFDEILTDLAEMESQINKGEH
jgi:hypothetical protein